MRKTCAGKTRKSLTNLLHTRVCEIINLIKKYSVYQSEIDMTFQELIEYYYPDR